MGFARKTTSGTRIARHVIQSLQSRTRVREGARSGFGSEFEMGRTRPSLGCGRRRRWEEERKDPSMPSSPRAYANPELPSLSDLNCCRRSAHVIRANRRGRQLLARTCLGVYRVLALSSCSTIAQACETRH